MAAFSILRPQLVIHAYPVVMETDAREGSRRLDGHVAADTARSWTDLAPRGLRTADRWPDRRSPIVALHLRPRAAVTAQADGLIRGHPPLRKRVGVVARKAGERPALPIARTLLQGCGGETREDHRCPRRFRYIRGAAMAAGATGHDLRARCCLQRLHVKRSDLLPGHQGACCLDVGPAGAVTAFASDAEVCAPGGRPGRPYLQGRDVARETERQLLAA